MQPSRLTISKKTLPTGFIGYKGSPYPDWGTGKTDEDWSGCYIGAILTQAKGYIISEKGTNIASVWKCSLKKEMSVVYLEGEQLSGDLPGNQKADLVKEALETLNPPVKVEGPLIPYLGSRNLAYVGAERATQDGQVAEEFIVPWNLVEEYLNWELYRQYNVRNYDVIGWRNHPSEDWRRDSEATKSEPSPTLRYIESENE